MLGFEELHKRLILVLLDRIHSGQLTERGISRITGVSQPHIHNVLKGKRDFSTGTADKILRELHMDIMDLLDPRELLEWRQR